jgi:hypothetical protein
MTAVFTSSSWRPEAALGVEWLDRDQQLGEETFQDLQQNRPRVGQARKCIREEYLREVGGILDQRRALLVAPHEGDELMPDKAKGLYRYAAFRA